MKLLRPLHRQRRRQRSRFIVLGNYDLAAHYGVSFSELQAHMEQHDLPFHKDSRGNMWASCELEPTGAQTLESKASKTLRGKGLASQKAERH